MALFITFEGGEGSGKSLQSKILYRKLTETHIPAILVHEPGGTLLGDKIRYLLKQSCDIQVSALSELLLFNASRSQIVSEVILPALKQGKVVVCDRFSDSTVAYQSFGRGLDLKTVETINDIACQGLKPDLTFMLDISPAIGLSRKKTNARDRFEMEDIDFHNKVREGFITLANKNTGRWMIIDSSLPINDISDIIWKKIEPKLKKYLFIKN